MIVKQLIKELNKYDEELELIHEPSNPAGDGVLVAKVTDIYVARFAMLDELETKAGIEENKDYLYIQ